MLGNTVLVIKAPFQKIVKLEPMGGTPHFSIRGAGPSRKDPPWGRCELTVCQQDGLGSWSYLKGKGYLNNEERRGFEGLAPKRAF